jgi:propionyl-CoA synthetase
MTAVYSESYQRSLTEPERFWSQAADAITWDRSPEAAATPDGWFASGMLNTCFNAIDRHVAAGRGSYVALIYDSPVTQTVRSYTFDELLDEVSRTAGMLRRLGVTKGERVIIYMPMIPQTVFAMLACARIGAIHSVVFGGFAAPELAKRIDDATPRIILTASCGIEGARVLPYKPLVEAALGLAQHRPDRVVIYQRDALVAELIDDRDLDWQETLEQSASVTCEPLRATDPLYILYTSGTTGTPKGVVRQNGGHAVALAWSMANIYGACAGSIFWAASDVGWVVGHSYIVYGPLLAGATTVLYEGKPVGTPDAGAFWRTIVRHGVDIFFTAPTALRAIRKEDPQAHLLEEIGTGGLRAIFLAGERADPETIAWTEKATGVPVIDHWWQTELGWPGIASCMGLGDTRRRRGSAGFPVPGYRFAILDDDGREVPSGVSGHIVLREPLPPGCYATLWNNPDGFARAFTTFEGCYETGDGGLIDEDGFIHVMGRTDDIINIAGHRLSTGQMEQVVATHPAVAECAVVGVDDSLKGTVPVALVIIKSGAISTALEAEVVAAVRAQIGPIASLKEVRVVQRLPKTRSGKILRAALRKIYAGEDFPAPPTIDDPAVIDELRAALRMQLSGDRSNLAGE